MKDEQNFQEYLTKKWIKEAGTDHPGDGFHLTVLKKISESPSKSMTYRPVISPLAWKFISGYIAVLFGISILFFPSGADSPTILDKIPAMKLPTFRLTFFDYINGLLDFSPQFITGIAAFFSIGFIMILITLKSKQAVYK